MSEKTNPVENRGPLQLLLADVKVWARAHKSPLGAYRLLIALQVAAECADRLADEMDGHQCPGGQAAGDDEADCRLCDEVAARHYGTPAHARAKSAPA